MAPGKADIAPALAQLSQLTSLQLGMAEAGDQLSATRAAGGWQVDCLRYLQPGTVTALARSFSGTAAPASQQEQLIAAEAAGQTSIFKAKVRTLGPSPEQASELASLGRELAAFDAVDLWLGSFQLGVEGQACPAAVRGLLQPVAARLVAFEIWALFGGSSTDAVLKALQRQPLPQLARLSLTNRLGKCPLGAVMAVAGLDAPRLATISLNGTIAGSTAAVVAAVTAVAMGRPQPVGSNGRPAGLTLEVSEAALSDEELGSVRQVVAAVRRSGWVTLRRPYSRERSSLGVRR
jgi:hypothetical protein